ncbi:MAG: ADP-ribosylglycohydrolase family protein [Sphaerochaeta sp.]|nr:ADP-ribosylglycohydrolase family protein [Sphaerochaeta sp.]
MDMFDRGFGSLLGLFVGDAFGAQTEFDTEAKLKEEYPDGILEMTDRDRWIGEAGMITDDSEMAIMLATSLIECRGFVQKDVRRQYIKWLDTLPSDLGTTILKALREGEQSPESQANGALMRMAPLALFGVNLDIEQLIEISDGDCAITHIHTVCRDANRLWALAIAKAVRDGGTKEEIYSYLCEQAPKYTQATGLLSALHDARTREPEYCDAPNQGWVLIALQQSLYTLLHSNTIEEGIRAITMRGGDADTNAAIYGMLVGAIEGAKAIPDRWIKALRCTRCLEDLLGEDSRDMEALARKLTEGLLAEE